MSQRILASLAAVVAATSLSVSVDGQTNVAPKPNTKTWTTPRTQRAAGRGAEAAPFAATRVRLISQHALTMTSPSFPTMRITIFSDYV